MLSELDGAKAILTTIGDAEVVSAVMPGLAPAGRLVLLGLGTDPLAVSIGQIVGGERGVIGSITGSPYESERTLDFGVLTRVRPRIEALPLEQAEEAYQKMRSGDGKFRMVLTMERNPMRINDDLDQPVIVHAASLDWVPSPAVGVDRKMLYREGDEVARATSIVRYAPGSAFPSHVHSGGEEILVLEGTFQDEHGDYPAGSYFRNPPGTEHKPAAMEGCTIFMRLWQYREGDDAQIVRQPGQGEPSPLREGASAGRVLFDDGAERVLIEDWQPDASVTVKNARGLELLVLSGSFTVEGEELGSQNWGRLPAAQALKAAVGAQGARIWIKEAPLQHPNVLPMPK